MGRKHLPFDIWLSNYDISSNKELLNKSDKSIKCLFDLSVECEYGYIREGLRYCKLDNGLCSMQGRE
jgi:hypothetical protein